MAVTHGCGDQIVLERALGPQPSTRSIHPCDVCYKPPSLLVFLTHLPPAHSETRLHSTDSLPLTHADVTYHLPQVSLDLTYAITPPVGDLTDPFSSCVTTFRCEPGLLRSL